MQMQATRAEVDTSLIDAARAIGPIIEKHNPEAERNRRLTGAVRQALHEAGLTRMFAPKSLGGLETDPITRAMVVEEIAGFDSAAGWTLENPLDWTYFCARIPDRGAEEIYAEGAAIIIAAQFGRPLSATSTEGGFRVSGRAPFLSNCYDADWIASTAIIDGDPESQRMIYFRRDECEIIDTWDAMGMRGTGSHDITVKEIHVPEYRTFRLVPEYETGSHYKGPLYRFPVAGIAASGIPPVMLGTARKALDEVRELALNKKPVAAGGLLKERTSAQFKLARAEAVLRSGRAFLHDTLAEAWQRSLDGGTHSLEQRADQMLAMTHALSSAVEAVELACDVAGTTAIRAGSPFERYFRDAQTVKHHAFAASNRYETVGKVYLGIEPDFAAVAL